VSLPLGHNQEKNSPCEKPPLNCPPSSVDFHGDPVLTPYGPSTLPWVPTCYPSVHFRDAHDDQFVLVPCPFTCPRPDIPTGSYTPPSHSYFGGQRRILIRGFSFSFFAFLFLKEPKEPVVPPIFCVSRPCEWQIVTFV